jgi:predicted kinase
MNQPVLRVVIGTAGSGKSTVAQRLAQEHSAAYLDKDTLGARFVEAALSAAGYAPGDRESNSYYRERILPLEYDSLLDVVGANLRLGGSVVVDAPFTPYLAEPHYITEVAQRFAWPVGTQVEVLCVRVSPQELQGRLRRRGSHRDQWKLANWDEYWAEHGERPCLWAGVHLTEVWNEQERETPAARVK